MLIQNWVRLSHSLVLKVSCVAGRMIAPWSAQLPSKTCQPCTSPSKSWYNASERVQKQDGLNGCIHDENTATCWPLAFVFFSLVSSSGTFDYLFSKLLWLKVLLSSIIFGVLNIILCLFGTENFAVMIACVASVPVRKKSSQTIFRKRLQEDPLFLKNPFAHERGLLIGAA